MPATCPYHEPARFSPYHHIPLPDDPSSYYPPMYAWVSQVVSFPQVSAPKSCINLSSPPYGLHAPPISFFSVLSPEQYLVSSTYHKLLIMWLYPLPSHLIPLRPKYSPQHPILKHPQPTFLPHFERPNFTPIQKTGKIINLRIFIFQFLDSKLKDKRFCTERQQAFPDFNLLSTSSWK